MARRNMGEQPKSGGDARILDWQGEDMVKLRILEPYVEEWYQYTLRLKNQEDADTVRFVVARPGDPLARKGWRATKRAAVNVWDYKSGSVKILVGGKQIFDEFDGMHEIGVDPMAADIVIRKMGSRRETKYVVNRLDSSPFEYQEQVDEVGLHDLSTFDQAPSVAELFRTLAELEIDYDAIKLPTFTLAEALAWEFPFGKHKGESLEAVREDDIEYLEYMTGNMEKQGEVGKESYIAMKTVLTDGQFDPYEGVPTAADYLDGQEPPKPAASGGSQEPPATPPAPPADEDDNDEPEQQQAQAPSEGPHPPAPTDDDLKGPTAFQGWLDSCGFGSFTPVKGEDKKWGGTLEGDEEDVEFSGYSSRRDLFAAVAKHLLQPFDDAPTPDADEPEGDEPEAPADNGAVDVEALREKVSEAFKQPPFTDFSVTMKVLEQHAGGKFALKDMGETELTAIWAEIQKLQA